jgi:hypothetical protein
MLRRVLLCLVVVATWVGVGRAQPLAEKYLVEGKLADGEKALQEHLAKETGDDQARFGLGVLQFLRSFERLGNNLYKYGLRTERAFVRPNLPGRPLLPQNPEPEKLTYAAARQILQTWVDDLNRAEKTLAGVTRENVQLPLHVGLFKIDPLGQGKPISVGNLFERIEANVTPEELSKFVIKFDRGDVCWFRGYCHFLAAWGELMLAVDFQELFECCAHLVFEKVDSPHVFLQEGDRTIPGFHDFTLFGIVDVMAFLHQSRFTVKEPERCKAVLAHLEAMIGQGKEMWKHILAETGDDNEWIPNPKQKGVLGIKVTQEMIDTWLATLDEAEQVLQGKKLVPFWRGKDKERGLNVRRMFLEPRNFDPVLWVQGTAATPYLEKGEVTRLADPRMMEQINKVFGGEFLGFAIWFN